MTHNPIFIDLETRSSADLRHMGGYKYAQHESTRLLTVAWADGEDYHVWMPGLRSDPPLALARLHLQDVRVHVGDRIPAALCRVSRRPWVGHNCWTFDRPVWLETTEGFEHVRWVDSYPLALAAGLPGRLDAIGKMLWGEGKYESGAKELKKGYKASKDDPGDSEPENVPVGRQVLIARYNVQDVRLLKQLWAVINRDAKLTPHEWEVLHAHDKINDRGCRVDRPLVNALIQLAEASKVEAIKKIAELTDGALPNQDAVQSRAKVLDWLDSQGFGQFKDKEVGGKKVKGLGLRKELVSRFIDAGRKVIEADDGKADEPEEEAFSTAHSEGDPTEKVDTAGLARVVNVLELRMQALRITGGKLDSALWTIDNNHRARGLFAYWAAHTGRWAGRRIQVQNLPRPKEGVDTWAFLRAFEDHEKYPEYARNIRDLSDVYAMLPIGDRDVEGNLLYPYLSADDASSGLLRGIFLPDNDEEEIAMADYASIEAVVLAKMANEKDLMQMFWEQGDPYLAMAERIFGPRDTWKKYPDPKKLGAFLPIKKHPYRQVGKVVVLGSGYQLGANQFAVYAASNGIDLSLVDTTPEKCITAFRVAHPAIAGEYDGERFHGGLWRNLNDAVVMALRDGVKTYGGLCTFHLARGSLICTLPSGRRLVYRNARLRDVSDEVPWEAGDKKYYQAEYLSPRYGWKRLYGGAITENIDQAISRDLLAAALVRVEDHGKMPVVLHCHDEVVSSLRPSLFPEFMKRVTTCPEWMPDFPLKAEGGLTPRYSKTVPPGRKEQVWRNGSFLKIA